MGKVYAPPAELPAPKFGDFFNASGCDVDGYTKAESEYVKKLSEYAKQHGRGKLAGEEIRFQVADGYARYIVFSTSPVELIHVPTGDAWQYQYANRLTASDIKEEVRRVQALRALFSKRASA